MPSSRIFVPPMFSTRLVIGETVVSTRRRESFGGGLSLPLPQAARRSAGIRGRAIARARSEVRMLAPCRLSLVSAVAAVLADAEDGEVFHVRLEAVLIEDAGPQRLDEAVVQGEGAAAGAADHVVVRVLLRQLEADAAAAEVGLA